jgi:hypothetical protein
LWTNSRAATAAHPQADHDTKIKLLKHLIEAFVAGDRKELALDLAKKYDAYQEVVKLSDELGRCRRRVWFSVCSLLALLWPLLWLCFGRCSGSALAAALALLWLLLWLCFGRCSGFASTPCHVSFAPLSPCLGSASALCALLRHCLGSASALLSSASALFRLCFDAAWRCLGCASALLAVYTLLSAVLLLL